MIFVQFLIIAFALLVMSRIILSFKNKRISFKSLLFWLGLWLAVSAAFLLPKTANYLAKILGFERGADLAVYFSILLIFYMLFRIFVKLERIETEITDIVRSIALRDRENQK